MVAPKCEVCGDSPENGIALYRTGEVGPDKDPKWRCSIHLESHVVNPEVNTIVAVIESFQEKNQ